MNIEQALRRKLQTSLEATTDYALETGDTSIYNTKDYHLTKRLLLTLIVNSKVNNSQPAATNYGGGGVDGGGNGNANK